MGIEVLPHPVPPSADRLHGECSRVMVHAHADPTGVVGDIVNAIRIRSAQFRDDEVVYPHLFGITRWTQFPPVVFEVSHQFLLFGVHRNRRLLVSQLPLDLAIKVFELGVAIRVTRTLSGFAVGLQTVSEIVQQIRDHAVARLVSHAPQLGCQLAKALACPA